MHAFRTVKRIEETTLLVTPQDLREWADGLEAQWAKIKLGQEVPKVVIEHKDARLIVALDQERMSVFSMRSKDVPSDAGKVS